VVASRGHAAFAAIVLGCSLVLTGCEAGGSGPSPTPGFSSGYETPAPTGVAPLRGTTIPAGSLDHSAVSAKIDNHPDARPQVGLERTDLLFEELVEGGLTRYVGVWQSDIPDLLGPVRSIRPMDPDIISPLGGIVCYSGGQQRFVALMRSTPVYNAVHGQSDTAATFFRTPDRAAPHNVLVKAKELLVEHGDIAAPQQQFAYALDAQSSTAAKEGSPTARIDYVFSAAMRGSWTWDPAKLAFLREQGRGPDLDASGAQLSATNVVVIRVGVVNDGGVPKTVLGGSGEAWVSSGGATVHATWSKGAAADPIRLVDDRGFSIRLAAGNTWIELVPTSGSVAFVGPA